MVGRRERIAPAKTACHSTRTPKLKMNDGVGFGEHTPLACGFSASRRKHRPTNFPPLEIPGSVYHESSGATPELTRGTRVLPIPVSEFGFNMAVPGMGHLCVISGQDGVASDEAAEWAARRQV